MATHEELERRIFAALDTLEAKGVVPISRGTHVRPMRPWVRTLLKELENMSPTDGKSLRTLLQDIADDSEDKVSRLR